MAKGEDMDFSDRLKELRRLKGVSQEKLAQDINISRSSVAKWENGLGMPTDESLKMLADYFGVTVAYLANGQQQTIKRSSKKLTLISIVLAVVFVGLVCVLGSIQSKIFDYIFPILLGCILVIMGVFNCMGNIASIHWYNRRKVAKQNQKAYSRIMGIGTIVIGVGVVLAGVMQAFSDGQIMEYIMAGSVIIGLAFILYAQFKYNKGIF